MADCSALKRTKIPIMSRFLKAEKYFLDVNYEAVDLLESQVCRERFDDAKTDYFEIQAKILEACDEEKIESETNEMLDFEDRAVNVNLIYARIMKLFKINVYGIENSEESNEGKLGPVQLKLPEVKLPEFRGLFYEWGDFKRDFEELVGIEGNKMDPAVKLVYLRGCLKEDAKLIESEEDTFESLWKALTNTYENQRYMINSCIDSILNEKSMSPGSPTDLKALTNNAKRCVRTFKQLNLNVNRLTEAILIHLIVDKLDDDIRNDFDLSLEVNELPDWNYFIDFLEKRSNYLESTESSEKKRDSKKE